MNIYPWHYDLWRKVLEMREHMPHALLLQGREGIGKLDFATLLAQALLCDRPLADHTPCGSCQSCNWYSQGNHPDFRMLEPEEIAGLIGEDGTTETKGAKKSQISVDQVRNLAEFLGLSSHRAGLRIVLIHPAEALNPASANALLKMLEEPPPSILFLLVTHNPQRLLATIRSRCNKVDMPLPPRQLAADWLSSQGLKSADERLAYAGGAPLRAMSMEEGAEKQLGELHAMLCLADRMDPFAAATLCLKDGLVHAVDTLQKWAYDLQSARLTGAVRYHLPRLVSLQELAKTVDLARLMDFLSTLNEARRSSLHPLNTELQVEGLMIQYTQLFKISTKS